MKNKRWLLSLATLAVLTAGLLFQQGDVDAAAALRSQIHLTVRSDLTNTIGLASATAPIVLERNLVLADGNGANQARVIWSDQRTIAASTTEDLDLLGGGLLDPFGVAFAPVKLRGIVITASTGNTNNIVLGGDANSVPFLSAAATTVTIQPGGMFVLMEPGSAGIAVTAGTGDIVQVANGGAGSTVTYSIILIGTSS